MEPGLAWTKCLVLGESLALSAAIGLYYAVLEGHRSVDQYLHILSLLYGVPMIFSSLLHTLLLQMEPGLAWTECLVFSATLALSAAIGLYYALLEMNPGLAWTEYLVFSATLALSAAIGLYYAVLGGHSSVDQYLLGGRDLGLLPVSASLVCSYISGVALLGIPTEVYTYGSGFLLSCVGFLGLGLILAVLMLPVLHPLQLVSLYQYLEMRFDPTVRKVVSFIYTVYMLLYISIVIYGPGIALNQVTGFSVLGITTVISLVCIFYTILGGLKAVVWSDTLQGLVMAASCLGLCLVGTARVGGPHSLLAAAERGQRLNIFNFDPDPRVRTSVWTMTIGFTFVHASAASINPSYLQRFTALSSLRRAQWASLWMAVGCIFFTVISCYNGLVLYAAFEGCDPLLSQEIQRPDQILPHFVAMVLSDTPGLPGAFLAGLVSAALSTMSTGINTVGGTVYADFLEPTLGRQAEQVAGRLIRLTSAVFGLACLALVFLVDQMGAILELTFSMLGLSTGAMMGVIVLGLFFPRANSKGAMVVMVWLLWQSKSAIRDGLIVHPRPPVSVRLCPGNLSYLAPNTAVTPVSGHVFPLYELSAYYFALAGCALAVLSGLLASLLAAPGPPPPPHLLSPLVRRFLPPSPSEEAALPLVLRPLAQPEVNKSATEVTR